MKHILKRLGLFLIVGMLVAPIAVTSIGCEGSVDDDGASLDVGD